MCTCVSYAYRHLDIQLTNKQSVSVGCSGLTCVHLNINVMYMYLELIINSHVLTVCLDSHLQHAHTGMDPCSPTQQN